MWGVWIDETFYHGGGPDTRKARNLEANPYIVVHLESGDDVIIIEGVTEKLTEDNADPDLLKRIDDAYEGKYGMRHGTPVWVLQPTKAFAWNSFPKDATRWEFEVL